MMDEQLRDNVEALLRGKREAPAPEFVRKMDAVLRPLEAAEPGRRFAPFAAIAAAAAFALILWLSRPPASGPAAVKGTVTLKGQAPLRQKFKTEGFRPDDDSSPKVIEFDPVAVTPEGRVRDCLVFVLSGLEGKTSSHPRTPGGWHSSGCS